MTIRFDDQVAIVTGAGNGLGRSHALALAARGAKVVVVDMGGAVDGRGRTSAAAEAVVAEIATAGGTAMAEATDVTDFAEVEAMVARVMARFGRVDILINNAGILRDKTFAKMDIADVRAVLDVHVMGTVHCTKAVWEIMRGQGYGRILMTASSSGLYGNFGQANYATAKAAMVGLMNTLHLEGAKYDIRVNTLAPAAATRMTEGVIPPDQLARMAPEAITPGVLFLVSREAPSRMILAAGGGTFAEVRIVETEGVHLAGADLTPEGVAAHLATIRDPAGARPLASAGEQTAKLAGMAEG